MMKRMLELIEMVKTSYPDDSFFSDLDEVFDLSAQARAQYQVYDLAFSCLDSTSWQILSKKALKHFQDHRNGQLKQGFFNQLNEAFAYQFLVQCGYQNIQVLDEDGTTRPDLTYHDEGIKRYCEVKTIGLSDDEIKRWDTGETFDGNVYRKLSDGFFKQLDDDLVRAYKQISSQGSNGLVFVLVNFDDFALTYYDQYHKQITEFLSHHKVPEVYIKVGLLSDKKIHKKQVE